MFKSIFSFVLMMFFVNINVSMKLMKFESSNESVLHDKKIFLKIDYSVKKSETATTDKYSKLRELVSSTKTIFTAGFLDKSFIITTIMSTKYPKLPVLFSAMSSLILMGYISVHLGLTFSIYLPAYWIDITSVLVFIFIGIKLKIDGIQMSRKKAEDNFANVQKEINKAILKENEILAEIHKLENKDEETHSQIKESLEVFVKTFTLIFLSELGDKSQISTIYLNSNTDPLQIFYALIIAQFGLTLISITIGKIVAWNFSEKTLTLTAGLLFLAFGIISGYLTYINDYVIINKAWQNIVASYNANPHFQKIPDRVIIQNNFLGN